MVYRKFALGILLSASLTGHGCGGGGGVPTGGTCTRDGECKSGDCEETIGSCTEECRDGTAPAGFTCVTWGSGGDPLCDTCPPNAPRNILQEQAGDCSEDTAGDGMTRTYVLSVLNIGQADPAGDPNVVPGFDLDGRVSTEDDQYGCFHPDFTSPPPDSEPGVDNQLGPLLMSFSSSFDIEGAISENIANGRLLILVTVEDIDDFTNDPCVTTKLERGTMEGTGSETPMLGEDGLLAPGQTINVDSRSVGLVQSQGEIAGGRFIAGPVDVDLRLPIEDSSLTLNIRQARLRFNVSDAAISNGLLGGALNVDETVNAIVMVRPEAIPESLARRILEDQADLQPRYDPEVMNIACEAVSIGLVYEGVQAFRGEVVTPTT